MGRRLAYAPNNARWTGQIVLDLDKFDEPLTDQQARDLLEITYFDDDPSIWTITSELTEIERNERADRKAANGFERVTLPGNTVIGVGLAAWIPDFQTNYPTFFTAPA